MLIKTGSVTRTQKAKHVLGSAGISARIKKLSERQEGCVHALEVSPGMLAAAQNVLSANGISTELINEPR